MIEMIYGMFQYQKGKNNPTFIFPSTQGKAISVKL